MNQELPDDKAILVRFNLLRIGSICRSQDFSWQGPGTGVKLFMAGSSGRGQIYHGRAQWQDFWTWQVTPGFRGLKVSHYCRWGFKIRSTLCWNISRYIVVIHCRRFGTTYLCRLQGQESCLISQKSAYLIYSAVEAWNHTNIWVFWNAGKGDYVDNYIFFEQTTKLRN